MNGYKQSCDTCSFEGVERIPRAIWMRLLPHLRHYHCDRCKASFLAPKQAVEARQWMLSTSRDLRVPPPASQSPDP